MGHNSVIIVRNDALDVIEKNGQEFATGMVRAIHAKKLLDPGWNGDFGAGSHGNPAQVVWNQHADYTGVIAVGGNHGTVLGSTFNGGRHHTPDEQLSVLRAVADHLGFDLVPRKP